MNLGIYPNITPRLQTKNNQQPCMPKTSYMSVNNAVPFGMTGYKISDALTSDEIELVKLVKLGIKMLPKKFKRRIQTFLNSNEFKFIFSPNGLNRNDMEIVENKNGSRAKPITLGFRYKEHGRENPTEAYIYQPVAGKSVPIIKVEKIEHEGLKAKGVVCHVQIGQQYYDLGENGEVIAKSLSSVSFIA